jgi:hypothetical protein
MDGLRLGLRDFCITDRVWWWRRKYALVRTITFDGHAGTSTRAGAGP